MIHGRHFLTTLSIVSAVLALTAPHAFAQCKPIDPPVAVVPMSAVIALGGHLSSDGKGAYADGTQ